MPITYAVNGTRFMSLSKEHLGSKEGEAYRNKQKDTSFIFPMTYVTILRVLYACAEGIRSSLANKEHSYP